MAIWYAITLVLVLGVYGGAVWWLVQRSLSGRLNAQLYQDLELAEGMLVTGDDGVLRWRGQHPNTEPEEVHAQPPVEAWSEDGELLYRSERLTRIGAQLPAPQHFNQASTTRIELGGGETMRARQDPETLNDRSVLLRVVRSEQSMQATLGQLALIEGLALPVGAAIAAGGGYFLARRALQPVARMTEQARHIRAEQLQQRLPVANPSDELGKLASVFNDTFARLEASFQRLQRFTADAAHELRTPLTTLRSVGESALNEPENHRHHREALISMLEEVERMTSLVDGLLFLSRADQDRLPYHPDLVDLTALVHEVTDDYRAVAEQREIEFSIDVANHVTLSGDRTLLRQAVGNLIDNAIKYSPSESNVDVRMGHNTGTIYIAIHDNGPGLDEANRVSVFERFYRLDEHRSRETGGAGLGLSIAERAVRVHGGRIEVSSAPGEGSTFEIVLPLHPVEKGSTM